MLTSSVIQGQNNEVWLCLSDINGKDLPKVTQAVCGLKSKGLKNRISVNHWTIPLCKHLSIKCTHIQDLWIQYRSLT